MVVTWWKSNKTVNEPVMKIIHDNGKTFGPVLLVGSDGTRRSNKIAS